MSTVLTNGIIIPDNGSRNWGGDLANNWNIIDVNVGYMNDVKNKVTTLENSVAENTANIQTNASNISALQTSKQDVIEDLETIRTGASSGATAVQPNALSNYYTKSEVDTNLSSKANDSDVVHKSGDETISGNKTFNGNLVASNGKDGACDITTYQAGSTIISSVALDGTQGAYIALCNKNDVNEEWKGGFRLSTSQSGTDLIAWTDGSLRWCNKSVDTIEEQGANYIRYTSGIQICFGEATAGRDNVFSKAFKSGTVPHINITHYTSNHRPYSATVEQGTGGATTNASFNFLLWDLLSGTYVNYDECHYIAVGYWK